MAFKVLNKFKDKDGHLYQAGDVYPAEGKKAPAKKRVEELSQKHPKYKKVFITEVEKQAEEAPTEK